MCCTAVHGGVLCARVVCLCVNALYCILQWCTGWCTAWYGGLLRSRVAYSVLVWCNVC